MLTQQKIYNLLIVVILLIVSIVYIAILLIITDFSKQTPTNKTCSEGFQCDNSDCILRDKVCDGKYDCSDNSDEKNCNIEETLSLSKCSEDFQCDNSDCISRDKVCDGKYDCSDNSDEKNCHLKETTINKLTSSKCSEDFQCDNSDCISRDKVCDGNYDCSDNTDEKNCQIEKVVNECPTPKIQNGIYKVIGNDEYISGPIPNLAIVNFTCINTNYILTTPYNTVHCLQGNYSHELPNCISTCSPEFSTSIDVECELNGIKQDCTKKMREGTTAFMKCKPNYIDNNPDISLTKCTSNGTWIVPPKQCTSAYLCPPRFSTAIDIFCKLNGVMQDCNKEVPEGTISYMSCKSNYIDASYGPSMSICLNGNWNIPPKQCIPDCDPVVPEGEALIIKGTSGKRGDFPWHVAIYRTKPHENRKYICGGSIISVKTVLSAAHCFSDVSTGKLFPLSEFSLAAGKHFNRWDSSEDVYFVQKKKVIKIEIPKDKYFAYLSHYAGDIAVLVVDESFIITSFIKPICVDWKSEHVNQQLTNGRLGKVVGWGSTTTQTPTPSADLKQLIVPYIERSECVNIVPKNFKPFVTLDKYCAGNTNGSSVCGGDSGGGMVFPHKNGRKEQYYLQGIVSVGPSKDGSCDDHQLGVYTKVNEYIEFIREIEESNRLDCTSNCSVNIQETTFKKRKDKECPPPVIKNGKYKVLGNNDHVIGDPIPDFVAVKFTCNDNYALTSYDVMHCISGRFEYDIPECVPSCPARVSTSVDIHCELHGFVQKCYKNVPEGTVATMECKRHYEDVNFGPAAATCLNGTWNLPIKKCIPECGESTDPILAANGITEFLWHASIYRNFQKNHARLVCGGSIISAKVLLSAAHCFTEPNYGILYPASEFSVVSGKYFSNWELRLEQHREIFRIYIPKESEPSYNADIAVVFVREPFVFSNYIKPVCVDWNSQYVNEQLKEGEIGLVAGWDTIANKKRLSAPFMDREKCLKLMPENLPNLITEDKFCAGFTNESNLCRFNDGNGIVFQEAKKKKYYILGVFNEGLSKNGVCEDYQLGVYTKVADHILFIKKKEQSNFP